MLLKIISQIFPLLILVSMLLGSRQASAMDKNMLKMHAAIVQDYNKVDHLSIKDFMDLEPEDTIVFDVREASEFKVSHISNAIQVDPDIKTEEFIEQYHEQIQNKAVVFYCSVGRRSSDLADRVDETLNASEFTEVYNLTGGLFEWHNNKLPLINDQGNTELIHPYNSRWGKLLDDKDAISYE